jgi:hypothetical protein
MILQNAFEATDGRTIQLDVCTNKGWGCKKDWGCATTKLIEREVDPMASHIYLQQTLH